MDKQVTCKKEHQEISNQKRHRCLALDNKIAMSFAYYTHTHNKMCHSLVPLLSAECVIFLFLPEEVASKQCEIDSIDDKLKQLTDRRAELQNSCNAILNAKDKKSIKGESEFTAANRYSILLLPCNHLFSSLLEVSHSPNQTIVPDAPDSGPNIFYVEAPPTTPGESCKNAHFTC